MRRFDVLNDHREAYATLAHELPRTPLEAGCLLFQLRRSLANTLKAAGLSASGLRGAVRIEGLGAIYAAALRVWLKDDSADLSKTMPLLHSARFSPPDPVGVAVFLSPDGGGATSGRPRAAALR